MLCLQLPYTYFIITRVRLDSCFKVHKGAHQTKTLKTLIKNTRFSHPTLFKVSEMCVFLQVLALMKKERPLCVCFNLKYRYVSSMGLSNTI